MYGNIPRNQWPTVSTAEEARLVRNNRYAQRQVANSPWLTVVEEQTEGRKEEGLPEIATECESGRRMKISALIPEDVLEDFAEEMTIHETLKFDLCLSFGGYTAEPFKGGWLNSQGEIVKDAGHCYSVSFVPNGEREAKAIAIFERVGRALGQEWLHIERSSFYAEHRKTGY